MEYGRAQDIRKQGLVSLLTDKLISGQGVGSSLGSALSERTQATFTGIKEKFDPLNIAKTLTFGSNFAPALLGRLMGRSKQDIAHFADDKKSKKLKKIPGLKTNSFKQSMNELLGLIYRSIVRADEDRKLYNELEKNKLEEEQEEENKRNDALIEALTGRKTRTQKKAERRKERKQEKREELVEPKPTTVGEIPKPITEAPFKSLAKRSITSTATKVGTGAAIVGAATGSAVLVGNIKDVIAKEEGVATKAYWDPKNQKEKVSIGYGHQITQQEYSQGFIQIGEERVPIKGERGIDTSITKQQAKTLLDVDLPRYEKRASDPLGSSWNKLNDDQKTALISYAYNVGSTSNLVKAGLREAIDSGDMQTAAKIIREKGTKTANGQYNKVLDERRQREAALFERTPTQKVATVPTETKTGNTIDTKSKENKDLKKEMETPVAVDKIVNNTNVMNQSALNTIKPQKEDDLNAYIKKVMLG